MAKDEKEDVAKSDSDAPKADAPVATEAKAAKAKAADVTSSEEKAPPSKPSAEPPDAEPEEGKSEAKAKDVEPAAAKAPEEKSSGKKTGSGKKKKSSSAALTAKADEKPSKESTAQAAAREHAEAPHAAHGHKPDRKQYFVIFGVLFGLTVLEVGLAQMPGISVTLMAIGLIAMALTKAACVGLFYMHLKDESKILRTSVMIPFAAPAIYALVLISDAAWRLTR